MLPSSRPHVCTRTRCPALQMEKLVNAGQLLPDDLILRVLREHFMRAHSEGTDKFLLDGFPRTVPQVVPRAL